MKSFLEYISENVKNTVVIKKFNNIVKPKALPKDVGDSVGWFANKYNRALGWLLTGLTKSDREFLESNKLPTVNMFRASSDNGTNLVYIDVKNGTYAFVLESEGSFYIDKKSKFSVLNIIDDGKSYKAFGIKNTNDLKG